MGTSMIWQFGRGMISNASVRFPESDDSSKMLGPYIQHTAQVDPGNSGGPLLIQTQGVPTGYAVAGINTLSARFRQAANYSIPIARVQSFLDASLQARTGDERPLLDARIEAFIGGLGANKAVYPHIADFLSNNCTAENAEFAISEVLEKAPRTTADDIVTAFGYSPVGGMGYAVAWTIENSLRSKMGKITISTESVSPNGDAYTVTFKVNEGTISSEWINEYGIWRIRSFGDFAAGDKTLITKKEKAKVDKARLRTDPDIQLTAGMGFIVNRGAAFGADITLRGGWWGYGLRTYIRSDFFQVDGYSGLYIPIKMGTVALTPYGNLGFGFQIKDKIFKDQYEMGNKDFDLGIPFKAGLQFTTAAIPGLYIQAGYQYNLFFGAVLGSDTFIIKADPHIIFVGLGYSF